MRCLLQQVDLLQTLVGQIDAAVAGLMNQLPQYITSIPGIGLITDAAILAEIGDVTRFESADKLVAYAGIDPSVYETGHVRASERHMSKRGSPYLPHALWLAASRAIRHDPDLSAFYQAIAMWVSTMEPQSEPSAVDYSHVCTSSSSSSVPTASDDPVILPHSDSLTCKFDIQ